MMVVAALLVVGVLGLAAWIYPWMRMPDAAVADIERDWTKVEQLGFGRRAFKSDDTLTQIEVGKLKPTLDALEQWHARSGGIKKERCEDSRRLQLYGRIKDKLRDESAKPSPQQIEAVLAVAHQMRLQGNALDHAIGFSLARETAEWLGRSGQPGSPAFIRFRPKTEDIVAAFARDAVCLAELAGTQTGLELFEGPFQPEHASSPPPMLFVDMKREVLVLKHFTANRLLALEGEADIDVIASSLDVEEAELPKSVLVRLSGPRLSHHLVMNWKNDIESYDKHVAAAKL